jgi:endonuclease/exonuclease/phosphatase family metal-dependent hydrolase
MTITGETRLLLREQILPHFAELARCRSTKELEENARYRELEAGIRLVLETPERMEFSKGAPARERYRFLAWNIERGTQLGGQLEAFRTHPYLKACDVVLLNEVDIGMARSGNRDVVQALARELGLDAVFMPCYLNLTKGSGVERGVAGENELGLHGNAVLSRYPLRNVRRIPLRNGIDKMACNEKRLGSLAAVAADVVFPNGEVTAVSVHLDAQSSQRHRRDQMRDVVAALAEGGPAILGGDWNTSTYNSSHAFRAILGFWLRVMMGVDYTIRTHYLAPYNRFEKELFAALEGAGFDYRGASLLGEPTVSYDITDPRAHGSLSEWVPPWCFPFIRWSLRNHQGRCPLKLDWFATRGLRPLNPVVLHEFREQRPVPLSDHDPVGVDVSWS